MTDDILQAHHKKFTYVFISSDINDPVKELEFEGTEDQFQKRLNAYFRRIILGEQGKAEFRDILKEKIGEHNVSKDNVEINEKEGNEEEKLKEGNEKTVETVNGDETVKVDEKKNEIEIEKGKGKEKEKEKEREKEPSKQNPLLETDTLNMLIDSASSYQIVPLTLPTKETNFLAVNCYIDDVGKLKNLPYNSRASRICNTDIHGDAFISKTYDNEDFKRVDFKIEEFELFLKNPPKSANQFSLGGNVEALMKAAKAHAGESLNTQKEEPITCSNCFKEGKLKKCGKCKKVYYCSVDCQRKDFIFHQRICS